MQNRTDLKVEDFDLNAIMEVIDTEKEPELVACLLLKNNIDVDVLAEHINDEYKLTKKQSRRLDQRLLKIADIKVDILYENLGNMDIREDLDVDAKLIKGASDA